MTAIKTMLVPTDFSEPSRDALRYACKLADACGASLEVFHAIETPYFTGGYMEMYASPPDFMEKLEQAARAEMEKSLTPEQVARYRVTFTLRLGTPAHEILNYVRTRPEIDLIVMATHGRGSVARLMMGSVTDKIVRAAPCPVLTIRDLEASRARMPHQAA